jgi:hypothetical protein
MTTTEPKHSQLSQFYHHHLFLAIAQSKQFKAAANKTRLQLRPLHQFKPKIQNQQSPSINLTKPRPVPPSISRPQIHGLQLTTVHLQIDQFKQPANLELLSIGNHNTVAQRRK